MFTQAWVAFTQIHRGKYPEASAQLDELKGHFAKMVVSSLTPLSGCFKIFR